MKNTSPYVYYSPRNTTNPTQGQTIPKQPITLDQFNQLPISKRYTITNITKNLNQEKSVQKNKLDLQNQFKISSTLLNKQATEKKINSYDKIHENIKQQSTKQKNRISANLLSSISPYSSKYVDNNQVKTSQQIQRLKNLHIDSNKIIQKSNQYTSSYGQYLPYQTSAKSIQKDELNILKDNYWKQRNQYSLEIELRQNEKKLKELNEKVTLLDNYKKNNQQLINYYKEIAQVVKPQSEYVSRQDLKNIIVQNMRELESYRNQKILLNSNLKSNIKSNQKQFLTNQLLNKTEAQKHTLEKISENDSELIDSVGSNIIFHRTNSNNIDDDKQEKIKLITSMEEIIKQNNKTYKILEEQKHNLKNITVQQNKTIKELQKRLQQNQKYIDIKQKQLQVMKSTNMELSKSMNNKCYQYQQLQNSFKKLSIEFDKNVVEKQVNRNQMENIKILKHSLETQIENLKIKLERHSTTKQLYENNINELVQNKAKTEQLLTLQIKKINQQLSILKQNQEDSHKISDLINQLHLSNQKNRLLQDKLKNIEAMKLYIEEQQTNYKKKIKDQQKILKMQQNQFKEKIQYQSIISKLNNQIIKLKQNLNCIEQQSSQQILNRENIILFVNAQILDLEEKLQGYDQQSQQKNKKLSILQFNTNSLQNQLNSSNQQLQYYKNQLRNTQNKLREHQQKLQQTIKQMKSKQSAESKKQQQQIQFMKALLKKYQAQLSILSSFKSIFQKQFQQLKDLNLRYQQQLQIKNIEIQKLKNEKHIEIDFITRKKEINTGQEEMVKNTPQQLTPINQVRSESASNTSMNMHINNEIITQTRQFNKDDQIINKIQLNKKVGGEILETHQPIQKKQNNQNLPQKPSILEKKKQPKKEVFQNPFDEKNIQKSNYLPPSNQINQSTMVNQSQFNNQYSNLSNIPQVNIQKIIFNYKKQPIKIEPTYTSRINHINNELYSPNNHQNNFIKQKKIISTTQQALESKISPLKKSFQKSIQKNERNSRLIMKQSLVNSGNYKINVISPQGIKQNKSPNQINPYFRTNLSPQIKNLNVGNSNNNTKMQLNCSKQNKFEESSGIITQGANQKSKLINNSQLQNTKR